MYYTNAPLVEVIAEVRWQTDHGDRLQQTKPGTALTVTPDLVSAAEEYFANFSKQADGLGFRRSERLSAPGNPGFPGQAAVRFRKELNTSPIFQIGVGLFTANGLPPDYQGWTSFAPVLREGVGALVRSRIEAEKDRQFAIVSLRYIDAFSNSFWGDKPASRFISDVLGFAVTLPKAVSQYVDPAGPASTAFQTQLPMKDGRILRLSVGEGALPNGASVVLDSLLLDEAVESTEEAVMTSFEAMHEYQAESFAAMAQRLGPLLVPGDKK